MVHDVLQGFRLGVEGGDGRVDDGSRRCDQGHEPEMAGVQWGLPDHEDEGVALLEGDVAARVSRSVLAEFTTAERTRMEQGATIIPAVRNEPLAMGAARFLMV